MRAVSFTGDPRLTQRFIQVAFDLYRGDPQWIPPDRKTQAATLRQNDKLTADNHLKVIFYDGEEPRARALLYLPEGGPGCIGFLEFAQDFDCFQQVLGYCRDWFQARGGTTVWAPVDIDTWHRYRFLTKGFDEEIFTNEPYNKPYYPEFMERGGFKVLETYHSKRINNYHRVLNRLKRKYAEALAEGYTIQRLEKKQFRQTLDRIYSLSQEIFEENLGFSAITRQTFIRLYAPLERIADPDCLLLGLAPDGSDAGFIFAYPEINHILRATQPAIKAIRLLAYQLGYRPHKTLNLKTIGVLKTHRATRLASALIYRVYAAAVPKGYRIFNHCLIRDGNVSAGLDAGAGVRNKEYCLYEIGW
jgi:hypothetical protein